MWEICGNCSCRINWPCDILFPFVWRSWKSYSCGKLIKTLLSHSNTLIWLNIKSLLWSQPFTWIIQHFGPYLQGQSMHKRDITSLAYGQRIKISFLCTLTYLFYYFKTLNVTAWLVSYVLPLFRKLYIQSKCLFLLFC